MSKPLASYVDGYTSPSRETTVVPMLGYPFSQSPIPDVRTQTLKRTYDVVPQTYSPRLAQRATVTNLLPYSEAITAANGWTLTNVTGTLDSANPADATITAYTFLETVTNAAHSIGRAATVTAAQCTLSLFVKASGRNFVRLQFTDSAATVFSGVFNIADGQVFASTNATATFIRVRDGYFRIMVTFTPAAGAGAALISFSTNGSTFSYVGDVTKGAVLWGAQLTLGGASVGYLPNNGAATVRSAPDADTANPFAWLVQETDPVNETSSLARIIRTFSMIPTTQVIPSSLLLTKPVLPAQTTDQTVGNYYLNRPNAALESYDAYLEQTVTTDSGIPTLYPTGGTYTLTFAGQTTSSLAYNASASAIASALNGLTSTPAFGTVAVSGTYNSAGGIVVDFGTVAAGSIDTSLLTATGSTPIHGFVYESNQGMIKNVVINTDWAPANPSVVLPLGSGFGWAGAGNLYSNGSITITINPDAAVAYGIQIIAYTQTTASIHPAALSGAAGSDEFDTSLRTFAASFSSALNALSNVSTKGGYTLSGISYTPTRANSVTMEFALPAAALNGGTFTLTLLSQTTGTIAYNASLATISIAVNALSNVTAAGGIVVSGTNTKAFTLTFAGVPTITAVTTSLTVAPGIITITPSDALGRVQTLVYSASSAPRILSVPLHGITNSDTIFLSTGSVYYANISSGTAPGTFTVLDVNTILLKSDGTTPFASAANITIVGKKTKSDYRPGTTGIRCLKTTAFYLPGVSYGIDDFEDVPLPVNQSDAATFLQAVFAGTGNLNWQVGEIMPWTGAILQQTTTTIAIEDI